MAFDFQDGLINTCFYVVNEEYVSLISFILAFPPENIYDFIISKNMEGFN